jgi:hypothetical protein
MMGNASLSHPTLATGSAEGVDGRVKPGHDVVGGKSGMPACAGADG